jgi:hypothetical protein
MKKQKKQLPLLAARESMEKKWGTKRTTGRNVREREREREREKNGGWQALHQLLLLLQCEEEWRVSRHESGH